jgi:hypothetical protein
VYFNAALDRNANNPKNKMPAKVLALQMMANSDED